VSSELEQITPLLERIRQGSVEEKDKAKHRIIELLYQGLKQRARPKRRNERSGHSWETTDLTHEALLRMLRKDKAGHDEFDKAANEHQLIRAFVRAVRQALIDHARTLPRGAGRGRELDDLVADVRRRGRGEGLPQVEVLALHEALEALAGEHPRAAEVLELRFFGGWQMADIAKILAVSERTVERDDRFGLAKLCVYLSPKNAEGAP
jgi:RNA polymerase sigma factor (TIGR02999 family)